MKKISERELLPGMLVFISPDSEFSDQITRTHGQAGTIGKPFRDGGEWWHYVRFPSGYQNCYPERDLVHANSTNRAYSLILKKE